MVSNREEAIELLLTMADTAKELAEEIWTNLNEDNKVSLLVRAVPLDGSEAEEIIINKNV